MSETRILNRQLFQEIAFKRLYDKHLELDRQVNQANEGHLAIDDVSLEKLKKKKLLLKDEMNKFIFEYEQGQALA